MPEEENAGALARELAGFVPLPDPELRDTLGYEIFARWVHRSDRLGPADLESVRALLVPNALAGLGEDGTDSVFGRSFSLLFLKELVAADRRKPFLTDASRAELADLAVRALRGERDLRGYVAGKGWAHATAHAADLVRVLAQGKGLTGAQVSAFVEAIEDRQRTATAVWSWGEDARMGAALAAIAWRPDVDPAAFVRWFERLARQYRELWSGPFDEGRYRQVRCQANVLAHLSAKLAERGSAAVPEALRTGLEKLRRQVE